MKGSFLCVYLAGKGLYPRVDIRDVSNGFVGICRCGCAYSVKNVLETGPQLEELENQMIIFPEDGESRLIDSFLVIHEEKGPGDNLFEESYDFSLR